LFDYLVGVLDEDVNMFEGQTSMVRAEFPGYGFFESQGLGPMLFGWSAFMGARDVAAEPPFASAGRLWGRALTQRMDAYARSMMIVVCVDDESHPENRVTLSAELQDEHNPAPHVRYRATDRTMSRRDWLARRAAEVLIAAGAHPDSIHRAHAEPSTIHMHGTMRMGTDPASSVVDPDGEAHGVSRLFIADTSVFPNAIGGPNPTLTAQAVATRIAERIRARYFGDG
jgi:choline dehydrogenase-like flavoprotein